MNQSNVILFWKVIPALLSFQLWIFVFLWRYGLELQDLKVLSARQLSNLKGNENQPKLIL